MNKPNIIKKLFTCKDILSIFLGSLLIASYASTSIAEEKKPAVTTDTIIADTLIVAGGCFWCVESDFEKYPGVIDVVSGYTGGEKDNPTYEEVASKSTRHFEAAKITFDTSKTNAKELTEYFWATIDPTDAYGQFCDKGSPYKTALFYQNDKQKGVFEESLAYLKKNKPFKNDIATQILPAKKFYLAEEYHQDYHAKSPYRYYIYRTSCGRDARIKQLWGKVASKAFDKY
jgi:peptide-methionine (S)-S-oxide reductase